MLIVYLIVGLIVIAILAGKLLVDVDKPKKSDAIIVLSGNDNRLETGVELFKQGYANYLILSKADEFSEDTLIKSGILKEKLILEHDASSTYTNAIFTKEIVKKHHFKSILVLTSEFHTSRSKYIFQKVYHDTGVSITVSGSKNSFFKPYYWFLHYKGIYVVISEYIKWIYYLIRY